jgi:hypothetical protein
MRRVLAAVIVATFVLVWPVEAQLFPTSFPSPEAATDAPSDTPVVDFTAAAANWVGHGRSLKIEADGHAEYRYRVYTWCTPGMTTPCDRLDDHVIQNGGWASFTFTSFDGQVLQGRIDDAVDTKRMPKGDPVRFELRDYGTGSLTWGDRMTGPGITLCGPGFSDAPIEVKAKAPCGA